jgi:glycine/D-amino acid oxidase-like deaminating enzyme
MTNEPLWTKRCRCGAWLKGYRGDGDIRCGCGAEYNAFGQELRADWRENASNYDEEIDDLEGMERAELRAETYESDRLDGIYFEPEYHEG